jgi:putative transposase
MDPAAHPERAFTLGVAQKEDAMKIARIGPHLAKYVFEVHAVVNAAAKPDLAPELEHRSHKGLNNRAENSHLPYRSRERVMRGHRSPGGLQRFVAMHSAIRNCFVPLRHRRSAQSRRYHRLEARGIWREAAGVAS